MIRYISIRLLFALPALWLILTMVFLLAHIVPGDPVAQMLGDGARADDLTQLRHALGLDLPLPVQYGRYLTGVAHGNLGESFRFQQPVLKVVAEHYPATLELAVVALLICALIGIPAGVLAAHKRGERTDHAVAVLTLIGLSVPNFALGPVLIPILTILGLQFGTLLAGTIVTESIFSWPGIGRLAVPAIGARDYPLLQGCILLIAVSYVFVNLLTDLVYALVDPRVRFE